MFLEELVAPSIAYAYANLITFNVVGDAVLEGIASHLTEMDLPGRVLAIYQEEEARESVCFLVEGVESDVSEYWIYFATGAPRPVPVINLPVLFGRRAGET